MSSGIAGPCECPLGKHHAADCPNYIDVWRSYPCPECVERRWRAVLDRLDAIVDAAFGRNADG